MLPKLVAIAVKHSELCLFSFSLICRVFMVIAQFMGCYIFVGQHEYLKNVSMSILSVNLIFKEFLISPESCRC